MTTAFYQYEAVKDGRSIVDEVVKLMRDNEKISKSTDLHTAVYDGNLSIIDLKNRIGKVEGDDLDCLINDILIYNGLYGEYQRVGILNIYYDN